MPFDGDLFYLKSDGPVLQGTIQIESRGQEDAIIAHWR
jgi:hypothetical protein